MVGSVKQSRKISACRGWRVWNSQAREAVYKYPTPHPSNNKSLSQNVLHLGSKFGDPSLNGWEVMMRTTSKWGKFLFWVKFDLEGQGWSPPYNRYLNQGVLHLWSKLDDPSLNRFWVITQTSKWLTHKQRTRNWGNNNTQRPKLASGKNCQWDLMWSLELQVLILKLYDAETRISWAY